jgi:predicted aspartyl protease
MGIFSVSVDLTAPSSEEAEVSVEGMVVDTGSEATWIPEEILVEIGIQVRKKDQAFMMANGQTITRDIGYAIIRCGEFETIDEVVFARKDDCRLLGARTLEGFNVRVDPAQKRLVAAGPLPAAGNRKF